MIYVSAPHPLRQLSLFCSKIGTFWPKVSITSPPPKINVILIRITLPFFPLQSSKVNYICVVLKFKESCICTSQFKLIICESAFLYSILLIPTNRSLSFKRTKTQLIGRTFPLLGRDIIDAYALGIDRKAPPVLFDMNIVILRRAIRYQCFREYGCFCSEWELWQLKIIWFVQKYNTDT